MTTAQPTNDVYDDAMNPQAPSLERNYLGEVAIVDVWSCVLEKSVGKRPFDPTRDSTDSRRIAIKLVIQPFDKDWTVDQETLNVDKTWRQYTLPSLQELGLDVRTLKGQFVRVRRVPTGDFYVNRQGEMKDKTALVFAEVFPDEETCRQAAKAFFKKKDDSEPKQAGAPQSSEPQPATDSSEREFARQALSTLWQISAGDQSKFLSMIDSNEMIRRYFPTNSPEVENMLSSSLQP